MPASTILTILGIKLVIGVLAGFIIDFVARKLHKEKEETKIEDLLPLITKTNSPIYVVNEERELKGLVPLSSIVVEMTGKDKNEINELIQNAIEL